MAAGMGRSASMTSAVVSSEPGTSPMGIVARIVTGPHDAHRQDPHLSRRYDTGSAEGGHPIQDRTAEDDLTPLPGWAPGPEAIADDGHVAEARVLHPALTMGP